MRSIRNEKLRRSATCDAAANTVPAYQSAARSAPPTSCLPIRAMTVSVVDAGRRPGYGSTDLDSLSTTACPGLGDHQLGGVCPDLSAFPLGGPPTRWSNVRRVLKASEAVEVFEESTDGELVVSLTLHGTPRPGAYDGAMTRNLVDGVLVALHSHRGPFLVREVAVILANGLGANAAQIETSLTDRTRPASALTPGW